MFVDGRGVGGGFGGGGGGVGDPEGGFEVGAPGVGGGPVEGGVDQALRVGGVEAGVAGGHGRSEEHTSELQSLMRISYAVFWLKKKNMHGIQLLDIETKSITTKHNIIIDCV